MNWWSSKSLLWEGLAYQLEVEFRIESKALALCFTFLPSRCTVIWFIWWWFWMCCKLMWPELAPEVPMDRMMMEVSCDSRFKIGSRKRFRLEVCGREITWDGSNWSSPLQNSRNVSQFFIFSELKPSQKTQNSGDRHGWSFSARSDHHEAWEIGGWENDEVWSLGVSTFSSWIVRMIITVEYVF